MVKLHCRWAGEKELKRRIFEESAKQRIMALVHGVLAILPFDAKNQLVFRYEHAGEGTFTDVNEAPVNRIPYTLIVNIDWYETADEYDIIRRGKVWTSKTLKASTSDH